MAELAPVVREALVVLDVHVRRFDGPCTCGVLKACPAYEAALPVLAEAHVLPKRRPGAALPVHARYRLVRR